MRKRLVLNSMGRITLFFAVFVALASGFGCQGPDCPAICDQTLACDVTFTPNDDPNLQQVEEGKRSSQESCEIGCRESLSLNEQVEACILDIEAGNPKTCRQDVLTCLGG